MITLVSFLDFAEDFPSTLVCNLFSSVFSKLTLLFFFLLASAVYFTQRLASSGEVVARAFSFPLWYLPPLCLRTGWRPPNCVTTRPALLILPWKDKWKGTFYLTFSFNLVVFILNLSFSFLKNLCSLLSAFPSKLRGIRGYKHSVWESTRNGRLAWSKGSGVLVSFLKHPTQGRAGKCLINTSVFFFVSVPVWSSTNQSSTKGAIIRQCKLSFMINGLYFAIYGGKSSFQRRWLMEAEFTNDTRNKL